LLNRNQFGNRHRAENFLPFVEEALQWRRAQAEGQAAEEERKKKEALEAAEKALLASKVLRGDRSNSGEHESETTEERKRRLELLARYDVPDEVVMGENGQVVFRDPGQEKTGGGKEGNDNAERVRLAELEKREKLKAESHKQKELAKTSAFDGKKKKEEAKEKRRQKAVKVERKRN
jgi:hypothetical protein